MQELCDIKHLFIPTICFASSKYLSIIDIKTSSNETKTVSKITKTITTTKIISTTKTIPKIKTNQNTSSPINEPTVQQRSKSIKGIEIYDIGKKCSEIGGNYLYHKYNLNIFDSIVNSICVKKDDDTFEILDINQYNIPISCDVGDKVDNVKNCFSDDKDSIFGYAYVSPFNGVVLPAYTDQLLGNTKKSREEQIEKDSSLCKELDGDVLYYNYFGKTFSDINSYCVKEHDNYKEIRNLTKRFDVQINCMIGNEENSIEEDCFYHVSIIEFKKLKN